MPDISIGHCEFSDGQLREVYFDGRRQYILDEAGERVYGIWTSPSQQPNWPAIIATSAAPKH